MVNDVLFGFVSTLFFGLLCLICVVITFEIVSVLILSNFMLFTITKTSTMRCPLNPVYIFRLSRMAEMATLFSFRVALSSPVGTRSKVQRWVTPRDSR